MKSNYVPVVDASRTSVFGMVGAGFKVLLAETLGSVLIPPVAGALGVITWVVRFLVNMLVVAPLGFGFIAGLGYGIDACLPITGFPIIDMLVGAVVCGPIWSVEWLLATWLIIVPTMLFAGPHTMTPFDHIQMLHNYLLWPVW